MNAKDILTRAVQCDQAGRLLEAEKLYEDGIQILMDMVMDETNTTKKRVVYERIKEYIDRMEEIKNLRDKEHFSGELVSSIKINEGSEGHSYNSLFGKYLDREVEEVLLEEPYLYEKYQFQNLIVFLELLRKKCCELKYIRIVTKSDPKSTTNQSDTLDQIKADISRRDIKIDIRFDKSLHDRKIVLSNGYVIKIGRGLHFYKATNPLYSLGLLDFDFRKCLKTDVDIWRVKNLSIMND